jgi:hypothetical protein
MVNLKRIATIISATSMALVVGVMALPAVSLAQDSMQSDNMQSDSRQSDSLQFELTPSSQQLADCMPDASLIVTEKPTTEKKGFDIFDIRARNLPPERSFTVFLLEQAGSPFGAAEYIGDVSTNSQGNGHNTFKLIASEAFSSTVVNGARVRKDLNRIGVWFADPADDDFCFGTNGGSTTPFDGDGVAGVQAFNSANADPLPAP